VTPRTYAETLKLALLVVAVALIPLLIWYLFDLILVIFGAIILAMLLRLGAQPFMRWLSMPEWLALLVSGLLVLFVIGGIGVTPILPMIRVAQQRGINWRAIYAGNSREHMPLLDEVMSVAPGRVTVWVDDEQGRLATVNDLLAGAGPTTAVYVCGPTAMLEAVRIARDEHADAPLHYERFSPPPVVDGIPFELKLARSRRVLSVPANRSALDVMLDRDPTTAYSCQQGFCGTCKVKVLAGQVDHRGRTVVDDDEMLVCVSRAKGDRVVIDA